MNNKPPNAPQHTPVKSDVFNVEIQEDGSIISLLSTWRGYGQREMIQTIHPDGYKRIRLFQNGKRKSFKVHALVASKFLEPRPTLQHEIRHLDGNRLNNHYSNLAWGTRKENADDREKHGHTSRGEKHSQAIKRGLHGN